MSRGSDSSRRFLAELRREIEAHPGVNHLFLARCATSPFSREDYRVFGENHYALVCVFTNYLERLLLRGPSSESKLWLAKVLVDEYGEGSEGEDHATLYGHFLRACKSSVPDAPSTSKVPAPAYEFIREHRRIVSEEPFLVGLGAVGPGHEWAIPKMFAAVIPGLRRAGFTKEEILYFELHVEQDVDHGAWLEEALAQFGRTEEARQQIRRGALLSLEARARFWSGVQRAVVRWRQPNAVRPDGASPRSIAREIMITTWDGSPRLRALESRYDSFMARRRPTIAELVEAGRR
ncbi:MAG: iron-containing redox enzyme family protein [Labilithrix sp.]|nr:iron-containing redox enzyme family protein [Labilithrix sp.]MCW5817777.1 iron-containing redox enzyme family protein [Labilithrix sp.]